MQTGRSQHHTACTQAAHNSTQQRTACQPTCPTGLITACPSPAHTTRLDPVCARDLFGASTCVLFRGRTWILGGIAILLERASIAHSFSFSLCTYIYVYIYIYIYTHVYPTSSRSFALLLFQVRPAALSLTQAPSRVPSRYVGCLAALSDANSLFQARHDPFVAVLLQSASIMFVYHNILPDINFCLITTCPGPAHVTRSRVCP